MSHYSIENWDLILRSLIHHATKGMEKSETTPISGKICHIFEIQMPFTNDGADKIIRYKLEKFVRELANENSGQKTLHRSKDPILDLIPLMKHLQCAEYNINPQAPCQTQLRKLIHMLAIHLVEQTEEYKKAPYFI